MQLTQSVTIVEDLNIFQCNGCCETGRLQVILRPCYTVQFFLQLAMQFYSWEMLISEISEEFSICWENISLRGRLTQAKKTSAECNEDSYLAILHLSRVELHCKLQEKLHRVTWPLHHQLVSQQNCGTHYETSCTSFFNLHNTFLHFYLYFNMHEILYTFSSRFNPCKLTD
jgi:hypothetical protein